MSKFLFLFTVVGFVAASLTHGNLQIHSGSYAATEPVAQTNLRMWVSIAVSFVILAAGLFVILSKKYEKEDKNWAFASVGTVVGYWLPSVAS